MEFDLSPKLSKELCVVEGGIYYGWSPSEVPMLGQANIGASKLVIEKNVFTLPDYFDSAKVIYVVEGNGRAGIILPGGKKEKVVSLKKGDVMALPFSSVAWWYNKDDTDLVILFLGNTSKAHKAGEFTDFFLIGSNSMFKGLSTEFVSRAWDLEEDKVKLLLSSQPDSAILKLKEEFKLPEAKEEDRNGLVLNCEEVPLDDVNCNVKNGGRVVVWNNKKLPLLGEMGFGAELVRLDGGAMFSPRFSCDSAYQMTYVVSGSGRVQVVGVDGRRVVDATVKAGHLFIVPRFFVVSMIADDDGMEWFSIITSPNPAFGHLAGRTSMLKALSPQVLQAAFNVGPDVVKLFSSKRNEHAIFFPPPN